MTDDQQATQEHEAPRRAAPDDDAIRELLGRLARPHRSGGRVVERASVLAAGADFDVVMAWILEHGGEAEAMAAPKVSRGLHDRASATSGKAPTPLRFILPASALG